MSEVEVALEQYDEHLAHIKYSRNEKSGVDNNILEFEHSVDKSSFKFVTYVTEGRLLDACERLEIIRGDN